MKKYLFVVIFCVFVFAGEVSAQRRWTQVYTPGMPAMVGDWYIDSSSIRRLPNGNVTYWSKGAGRMTQKEVNCVDREEQILKVIKLASTDSYGNRVNGDEDITNDFPAGFTPITPSSISDNMSGMACKSAKTIVPRSEKQVTKSKAVKKARKKKQ